MDVREQLAVYAKAIMERDAEIERLRSEIQDLAAKLVDPMTDNDTELERLKVAAARAAEAKE